LISPPFWATIKCEEKALTKAQLSQGGPQRLLLRAAGNIADAATYDAGSSSPTSSDDETDALTFFARQSDMKILGTFAMPWWR
jgi:hypothetical protein